MILAIFWMRAWGMYDQRGVVWSGGVAHFCNGCYGLIEKGA